MRSLTFTVHFADDIGPEEANAEIAREIATIIGDVLTLGTYDSKLLDPGHALGIEVADTGRVVRVREVDWTGGR